MIKEKVFTEIINAINKAVNSGSLGVIDGNISDILTVEKPKNPEFGDYAVNISPLARFAKLPPVKIAEIIVPYIDIEDTEINVISGFINLKLGKTWLNDIVKLVFEKNKDFGRNNFGNSEKVLLEYVSANPTGPLHIGHGRWAAVGSSLANIMKFAGYDVTQEFYVNDTGTQIGNLVDSLLIRILQEKGGSQTIPTDEKGSKNYYPGDYLIDLAKKYIQEKPEEAQELYNQLEHTPYDENIGRYVFTALNPVPFVLENICNKLANFAKEKILNEQKSLLDKLRVHFDVWYYESTLHNSGEVEDTVKKLESKDKIYKKDDALWFKSSEYGDDQDRVIKKSDGKNTYLTADIAFHYNKLKRGYEKLINIWGADHHGYVPRIKAAIEALGYDSNCLEVLLGQLVNLIISGETVRMGKRRKMYTLEELVDEVGVDATRYWMVMRSIDTTLDFDVELAKSRSDENPVYYVQYAHARACSILRTAASERPDQDTKEMLPPFITQDDLDNLTNPEKFNQTVLDELWNTNNDKESQSTRNLVLKLEVFQDVVLNSAKSRTPYQIARYIQELAGDFHYFYTFTRVLNIEESIMKARLCLVYATKQVIANALSLLEVSAPQSM